MRSTLDKYLYLSKWHEIRRKFGETTVAVKLDASSEDQRLSSKPIRVVVPVRDNMGNTIQMKTVSRKRLYDIISHGRGWVPILWKSENGEYRCARCPLAGGRKQLSVPYLIRKTTTGHPPYFKLKWEEEKQEVAYE